MNDKKHAFWNSRATLGTYAGTYDADLKHIVVKLPSFGEFGYSKLWVWRKF